ncbi:MAG: hypothetical protein WCE79_15175 [Xanthobacteraceae bacterium]
MGKAICSSSKLTRRAAIGAALAGAATPALPAPDAAFALIATHQKAFARLNETIADIARLEDDIPEDRRQEWAPEDRDEGIGLNDDPHWTAALDAHNTAIDAETGAAWVIAHAQPATIMGAAALLRYAADYEAQGDAWPDAEGDESWHAAFHRSIAAALEIMGR